MTNDSAPNIHKQNSDVKYAYLCGEATIDGESYDVTVTVRKSRQKNRFWVHEVRTEKREQDLSSGGDVNPEQEYIKALVPKESVPQPDSGVKLSDRAYMETVKTGDLETARPKTEAEIAETEVAQADRDLEATSEAMYSVREIVGPSGRNYGIGVYLDSTLLSNLTKEERVEMVKEFVKELGGSVFTAYDSSGDAVPVRIVEANRKFRNKGGKKVRVTRDLTSYLDNNEVKQEAIALVDELILASTYKGKEPATHPHDWLDNNGENEWDLWTTYIQDKKAPSGWQS